MSVQVTKSKKLKQSQEKMSQQSSDMLVDGANSNESSRKGEGVKRESLKTVSSIS